MLTGDNGILTQAQKAKNETEKAARDEAAILDEYNNTLNNWINGGIVSIPEGLEIGSTVHYDPNGTYSTDEEGKNPLSETYSGSNSNPEQLDSYSDEFNIDTWKVFDINESTGEVTLVPGNLASGHIYLRGAQGYNNGVNILNDACSALYGDSGKRITARSINIDDIEGKMTSAALQQAHNFSVSGTKWGEQVSSAYSQDKSHYASIYAQEKLNGVNGTQSPSGLDMSDRTNSLIEPTANGATDGYIQGTSIRPTQTYWYGDNSFMQGAFQEKDGVNYYNLLFPKEESTYYWVASRCVNAALSNCHFNMYCIAKGMMNGNIMYNSGYSDNSDFYYGLFPVVSLSSKLISEDANSGFVVE